LVGLIGLDILIPQLMVSDSHCELLMQHPWSSTVRLAIDLEAMGTGGKSSIFQV